jgi:hypothetical protein
MYMAVVHGGHILVHDVLGGYIVHDSLSIDDISFVS